MYVGNMQNTVESRRTRNIFYPGTPQILNELTQFLTCPVRYESRSQVEIRAQRPVELGLDSGTTKFNKIRKQSLVKSKQPKVPCAVRVRAVENPRRIGGPPRRAGHRGTGVLSQSFRW